MSVLVAQRTTAPKRASWQSILLPVIGIVGAPMMLIEALIFRFQTDDPTQLSGVLGLFYSIGWLIALLGLWRMNATGRRAGRIVLGIEIVGVVLAVAWAVVTAAVPNVDQGSLYYQVIDTAWPASHTFMLVVGVAAMVANSLPGWRRFMPLLVGCLIPVTALLIAALGDPIIGRAFFGIGTAAGFAALAVAVRPAWT